MYKENLYFYLHKQTGKAMWHLVSLHKFTDLLLPVRSYLLNHCRLDIYSRYMWATIIPAIILGMILPTQMLSHLHAETMSLLWLK